jgi:hypothetical protein
MASVTVCPKCARLFEPVATAQGHWVYFCRHCQMAFRPGVEVSGLPLVGAASQLLTRDLRGPSRPEVVVKQNLVASSRAGVGRYPPPVPVGMVGDGGGIKAEGSNEDSVSPIVWGVVGFGVCGLVILGILFATAFWGHDSDGQSQSQLVDRSDANVGSLGETEGGEDLHPALEEERQKLEEARRQYEEMIAQEEKRRQEEEERRRQEEEARAIEEARQRELLRRQMGAATLRAWRELQQVEATVNGMEGNMSEICRTAASKYAQIDLTDVDPELSEHVQDLVTLYRDGIRLWEAFEGEMKEIEKVFQGVVGLGAAAGIGLDAQNPQAGAVAGGLLVGLAGLPAVAEAKQEVTKRYKSSLDKWWSRLNTLQNREQALASELSDRYGTTFIDAL